MVEILRAADLPIEIIGSDDDWRQIFIFPRERKDDSHKLIFTLKTNTIDHLFFRRQIPAMTTLISQIPAKDTEIQNRLLKLTQHLGVCIGMAAEPGFSDHEEFIEAMTLVARQIEGFFSIHTGFLDSESRAILLNDGTSNRDAELPSIPQYMTAQSQPRHELPTQSIEDLLFTDETTANPDDPDSEAFDPPINPPLARRVAERMYVLLSLAYRGALESNPEKPERIEKLHRLGEWFWGLEIGHEIEDMERYYLDRNLGEIPHEESQQLAIQFESVMVLAWALRLLPLNPHDEIIQPIKVAETLGLFGEDTHVAIDSAELRSFDQIRTAADRIMAIHWRLREYELNPEPINFYDMAKSAWFGELDIRTLPLAENDLAFNGVPISKVDATFRRRCQLGIQWRHRALNWLCGHHVLFSQVDVST